VTKRPSELRLTLAPQLRFHAIDLAARFAEAGNLLRQHQRALFCSFHTTAGYLDQSLSARLDNRHDLVSQFFRAFRALFPQGAEYRHDQMHLRSELSDEQKAIEPRNGDSHLTFIGSGMKNCVTYRAHPSVPVYFIDLDGKTEASCRERRTTILGYDCERVVKRITVSVPVSRHPIDSINLADPRLGLLGEINDLIAASGIEHGRVDMFVHHAERNVGLTVNEYETMLIQNDLVDVLSNPLRFARMKTRHMLEDPLSIPGKTLSYAKYDAVVILNSLMEALRLDQSSFERLIAKVMSLPARHFLKSRRVSFLAACDMKSNAARLQRGTYQSPILVQWQPAENQTRHVDIQLTELL
jgi:thiamine phosphate synthase YjbQ (UPF0047 family)